MWRSKPLVVISLVVVSAFAWWAGAERSAADVRYRVVDVLDGDTIVVRAPAATTRRSACWASTRLRPTIRRSRSAASGPRRRVHEPPAVREGRHARGRRRAARHLRAPTRVRLPRRRAVQRRVAPARVRAPARDRPEPRARTRHARRGARRRAPGRGLWGACGDYTREGRPERPESRRARVRQRGNGWTAGGREGRRARRVGRRAGGRRHPRRLGRRRGQDRAAGAATRRARSRRMLGGDVPINPPFEMDNRSKRSIVARPRAPRRPRRSRSSCSPTPTSSSPTSAWTRSSASASTPTTLLARNPRLVYGLITGYGIDGPGRRPRRPTTSPRSGRARASPACSRRRAATPPFQRGGMGDHGAGMTLGGGDLRGAVRARAHRRGPARHHLAVPPGHLHDQLRPQHVARCGARRSASARARRWATRASTTTSPATVGGSGSSASRATATGRRCAAPSAAPSGSTTRGSPTAAARGENAGELIADARRDLRDEDARRVGRGLRRGAGHLLGAGQLDRGRGRRPAVPRRRRRRRRARRRRRRTAMVATPVDFHGTPAAPAVDGARRSASTPTRSWPSWPHAEAAERRRAATVPDMNDYIKLYIGGAWVDPVGTGRLEVVDPTTEQVYATVPEGAAADADRAVAAAKAAFPAWARPRRPSAAAAAPGRGGARSPQGRALRHRVARDRHAPRPLAVHAGRARIAAFNQAADVLDAFEFEDRSNGLVVREPIGVVGAITPWNYPLNQIGAKVALRAGRRLHRGAQAVARSRRSTRSCSPRSSTRSGSRPACSTSSPGSGRWSARRSPRTPTSTWSRSPARPRRARASPSSRRRR